MNPKTVIYEIKQIVDELYHSNEPNKSLVINDLSSLIHRLSAGTIRPPMSKDGAVYIYDDALGRYTEFHSNENQHNKSGISSDAPEFIKLPDNNVAWLDDSYSLNNSGYGPVYYYKDRMNQEHWLDKDGMYFRPDGPALVTYDREYYYKKPGMLHNETGPAIISIHNEGEYYINGKKLNENEWKTITKNKQPKRIVD